MILRITKYGEAVLREKTQPITRVTPELLEFTDDMIETMHKAKGCGLAAQQVGRLEKMCVVDVPQGCDDEVFEMLNSPIKMPLKLFNPEIIAQDGTIHDKEGCLSFPSVGGSVTRAQQVVCQYIDENNMPQVITAYGFLARALQHEIDHLNGILYIDRMSAVERLTCASKLKKLAKANGGVR